MRKFKVRASAGGMLVVLDGIEWQGKLWIVPNWLDSLSQGVTMPARIIRFDNLMHSDARGTGNYVLTASIPKELLEVKTPQQDIVGYEYIELPDIQIALDTGKRGH
jgi:hypothetical protein